jgi:hypothetical protein
MLSGCASQQIPIAPQQCPQINLAPLRITPIPEPLATKSARDAGDYILQLKAAIQQCNADKEAVR